VWIPVIILLTLISLVGEHPFRSHCARFQPTFKPLNRQASNNSLLLNDFMVNSFKDSMSETTTLCPTCHKTCRAQISRSSRTFRNIFPRYQRHRGAYPGMVIYAEGKDNRVPYFRWKRNGPNVNRWGLTLKLMTPSRTAQVKQKCQKCQGCFS
jgi:hypothetical protein